MLFCGLNSISEASDVRLILQWDGYIFSLIPSLFLSPSSILFPPFFRVLISLSIASEFCLTTFRDTPNTT